MKEFEPLWLDDRYASFSEARLNFAKTARKNVFTFCQNITTTPTTAANAEASGMMVSGLR